MMDAKQVIEHLKLEPLTVEGGYFKETYRSTEILAQRERCIGTSIYYLLKTEEVSRWHRVKSDEIWMYHLGAPAIQLLLFADGSWGKREKKQVVKNENKSKKQELSLIHI
eukprot:TRINITY_DN12904_c0_g1_i2.p2 TRINITY_DN12904_c0_g1~~TRINITY_DN12904_c0_g1_i2.p2  ORF type:complete len:110 (+),score=2.26 TRINITY_DN12904_c0_g1_i2:52-381(+)